MPEHADQPTGPAVERHEAPVLDAARTPPRRCRRGRPARPAGSCGRTGRTRTTAPACRARRRPGRPRRVRAAWVPIAMALSQCSTRITSPKRRLGQRATSPAATTPGAAAQVASQSTPLSSGEPGVLQPPGVGAHADADDDEVHVEHGAVGEADPLDAVAALDEHHADARGARRRRGRGGGRPPRTPSSAPRPRSSGTGRASIMLTSMPSPRQVAATSAPMNPAPTTATRRGRRRQRGADGLAVVEGAQRVHAVEVIGAGQALGRGARRDHEAVVAELLPAGEQHGPRPRGRGRWPTRRGASPGRGRRGCRGSRPGRWTRAAWPRRGPAWTAAAGRRDGAARRRRW